MKIRNRTLNRLLAVAAARLLRAWLWTCRVEVRAEPGTSPFAGRLGEPGAPTTSRRLGGWGLKRNANPHAGPHAFGFYPFWHEWVVLHVFARPHAAMAGLISRHRDGGYLADAMTAVGLKTVRGSSSRGGAAAVKRILDECATHDVGITPDGPRGPRRKLKPGVAFLASKTGRPVVPTAVACSRPIVLKGSWTDLILPRPFSTVAFCGGPPLFAPPHADRAALAAFCERVEAAIAVQEDRATALLGGREEPAATELRKAA